MNSDDFGISGVHVFNTLLPLANIPTVNCSMKLFEIPTPIDENNTPNLEPLKRASEMIANVLEKGNIVIFESTVYPGATEEVCIPILEKISDLQYNVDFFAGYSPERINPGDKDNTLTKIMKITSGSTPEIANLVNDLSLEERI